MPKPKTYTCGYKYCQHDNKTLTEGMCAKIGKYHYHYDCAEYKQKIAEARDLYYNNISNTVVMSTLLRTINNIVFGKKVDPSYLVFAIRHAISCGIEIKSPYSLHYLIDNKRIKQLWDKQQKKENEKKLSSGVMQYMPTERKETTFSVSSKTNKPKGFGDIFGGD